MSHFKLLHILRLSIKFIKKENIFKVDITSQ